MKNGLEAMKTAHKVKKAKSKIQGRANSLGQALLSESSTASEPKSEPKPAKRAKSSSSSVKSEVAPPKREVVRKSSDSSSFQDMVYLFVARDSDMIVYEAHLEKQIVAAKFQAEVYELLNQL